MPGRLSASPMRARPLVTRVERAPRSGDPRGARAAVRQGPGSGPRGSPAPRSRRGELAILSFGEVLVGWAVAVARQRHTLAGCALTRRRAALRRSAAHGGIPL